MVFQCKKCLKYFKHKDKDKHFEHEKNCTGNSNLEIECYSEVRSNANFECSICKTFFTQKVSLNRHIARFHCHDTVINNKIKSKTINNVTNNNIINIPSNFIREHGKERIDHITKEMMLKLLKSANFNIFSDKLVKELYFNIKVPENNNWCIIYPHNGDAALSFNNDTKLFERKSTRSMINEKFENMLNLFQPLIEEIYKEDEIHNNLTPQQRYIAKLYYGYFGVSDICEEDNEIYEEIHKMAYQYKSIPTQNWKEHGFSGNHLSIKF